MKKLWTALIGLSITASLTACGGNNNQAAPADQTGTTTGDAASVEAEAIYKDNCMACHATDLSGGGSFPNLQAIGSKLSLDEITNRITNGGGGMPAFKGTLSDDEINTLAKWLEAKK